MSEQEIQLVEPTLSEESMAFVNRSHKGLIKEGDVDEYIKHAIGEDGNRETFANFISIIDRFSRDDERFKRISQLHIEAKKSNEKYNELFKEAVTSGSKLSQLIKQRTAWSKKNLD